MNPSGILIEDYEPVTKEELNAYLIKVNDTLKMDSINIFLSGENVEKINPDFHKGHFIKWFHGADTLSLPKDINLGFGTFNGEKFIKNDQWDKKLLNNRFLKDE